MTMTKSRQGSQTNIFPAIAIGLEHWGHVMTQKRPNERVVPELSRRLKPCGVCPIIQMGGDVGLTRLLHQGIPLRARWKLSGLLEDLAGPGRQPLPQRDLLLKTTPLLHGAYLLVDEDNWRSAPGNSHGTSRQNGTGIVDLQP
jgi:hypothetical protein